GIAVTFNIVDCHLWVNHTKIHHRVNAHRDVIFGDQILCWHIQHNGS
ncbi:hypothetical protein D041_0193, partial [Vibrio parahaemolyticus EKP-008]